MSALAVTPEAPRVISRGSASCRPKISQQESSPRISSQVPGDTPVGRAVRWAVQIDGVTWRRNAAVSTAHDQETPVVSWVTASLQIWGTNCGTAKQAAAMGA